MTDRLGTYRGSRLSVESCQFATADEIAAVLPIVSRAAECVQQLGYFGPLGIDAMLYQAPDGQRHWRPLQDINARCTMGRVALGLRRIVPPTRQATWLRLKSLGNASPGEEIASIPDLLPAGTTITHITPRRRGSEPVPAAQWFLLTAETKNDLFIAEACCLNR